MEQPADQARAARRRRRGAGGGGRGRRRRGGGRRFGVGRNGGRGSGARRLRRGSRRRARGRTARRLRLGVGRAAGRSPGGDRFDSAGARAVRSLGREPVGQRVAPAGDAPVPSASDAASPSAARAGGAPSPRSSRPRSSSASMARPNAPNTITTAVRPVRISTPGCTRSRAAPTDSFTPAKRSRTVVAPASLSVSPATAWNGRPQAGSRPYAFVILPHGGAARGNRTRPPTAPCVRGGRPPPQADTVAAGAAMPNGRSPTMLMRSITRRWGK